MSESRQVDLLPKKLRARLEHFKAELPTFQPVYDRVFVYPLETYGQPDKTAGGIIIAEQQRRRLAAQVGLLIGAGVKAIEELYGHGVELGDIVMMARFSHWERGYFGRDNKEHRIYILQAGEIVGSEDLKTRIDEGDIWMEMSRADGKVMFNERDGDRQRSDPPRIDLGDGV